MLEEADMKKPGKIQIAITSILFLLVSATLMVSCAKKTEEKKSEEKNEQKMLSFEMPEVCGGCHSQLFKEWQVSMHQHAFIDPLYWAEAELAGKEAGDKVRDFCHSCHAAAATMIEKIPADANQASALAKSGVPCDFCHSITKIDKIGNKRVQLETASNTKRGPYKDSYSPYHMTEYSEIHTKAEFCAICHNVYHPVNGLPIENPYEEWKNGPYAKEGIQCQDCHMTPGPGVTKPNPGVVAAGGPNRDHYYTHSTVGGNTFITRYLGNEEGAKIAEERLKSAADISITNMVRKGNSLAVSVKVTNKGAGHYLPTGLTVMRQMWLYVKVTDATGKVLFESGKLDAEGNIPEGTVLFNTVYADKAGKPTEKVWEAEKILYDKRIPPKESVTEVVELTVPSTVKTPIKIDVELLYRSAPQHIVDKLMKDKPRVPVVIMAKTSKQI